MTYYAKIAWKNNTPFSIEFDDIYFSTISGIEETKYVFIQHNDLINRFKSTHENDIFVIAETGFGFGLNFLVTCKLWQEYANKFAKLFFISFENHPIAPEDLKKVYNNFEELSSQANELISQYYLITPSTHRFTFKHNIYLNLIIGDINTTITQQKFIADAWFLDGFTPNKNKSMWNEELIEHIRQLSSTNTTFATFTANSEVRRLLSQNGFIVKKDKGYSKREMLFGELDPNTPTQQLNKTRPYNWFIPYKNINDIKHVIIIGGGISGAATAYSLANRGYKVTLYESHSKLAMEASGNPQGMLYGRFAGNYTPILELSLSGYRYSHRLINKLLNKNIDFENCGIIELDYNDRIKKQHQQILKENYPPDLCYHIDHEEIFNIAGLKVNSNSGLYFPYGLWVDPQQLVEHLISHPYINVKLNTNIIKLIQVDEYNWKIIDSNNNIDIAPNIVLCNSHAVTQFTQFNNLYLRKIRGQISIVPRKNQLHTILCNNGYITPNKGDSYVIGATFKIEDNETTIKLSEHIENVNNFTNIIPQITKEVNLDEINGKVSFRSSTTDYVPVVGPIAEYNKFKETYKDLAKDSNYWIDKPCPYLKGLFINVAHGAKGILTAPICGEIIADYIDNTPLSISESLKNGLHPNRFWRNEIITSRKQ
ncbi:MAG: bifunctional tRNA (5-methylaminomethyl-2-thiouridine)(34)-methyltransferase MnmD/FAD-dependent 5-carboxymethylaminomethyl-2-thiouridine(34) oxidoreductase MnmC [Neisseriaceae bacterium]